LNVLTRKDSGSWFPFYQVRAAQFISWHKVFVLFLRLHFCCFKTTERQREEACNRKPDKFSFIAVFGPHKVLLRQEQEGNAFQMLTK